MNGRIPISEVHPQVDCAARPAKAVVDEVFEVRATVFREGHDAVSANVVLRDPRGKAGPLIPMHLLAPGTDRWGAQVSAARPGRWTFTVEGWSDPVASWRHDAGIKVNNGIDTELMLEEGARLFARAAEAVPADAGQDIVLDAVTALRDRSRPALVRLAAGMSPELSTVLATYPVRDLLTTSKRYPLLVERRGALFASWYEFFPRSEGATLDPPRSGTFRTAAERLPAIAAMGFDVVYLPPIHPIGRAYRKGPNNTLTPGPNDPGSPWAIGGPEGGHKAVHPQLGTLDIAFQCSPDHPYVREHPGWFKHRPDGTIKYAENPPKKYQDIYPLDFECADWQGLWHELLDVTLFWVGHGVRIFRVDNP